MELRYDKNHDLFYCISGYDERHIPKQAKFLWNPDFKRWWTKRPDYAFRLYNFASDEVKAVLDSKLKAKREHIEKSRATDSNIDIPKPAGLEYMPFQKAGIDFVNKYGNALIADEMGLGKTIQAIGAINLDDNIKRVIIVVPASLRINWKREICKWLVRDLSVDIALPKYFPDSDIVIVNYDILKKLHDQINAVEWDLVIMDEAHYIKNQRAQRTKEAHQIRGHKRLLLTGTPILNRPVELFSLLNYLDAKTWKSFFRYAKRYCNAFHNGYGWDFTGASNLDELQERLRSSLMIRRLKKDVLTELPAKRRQVIEVPPNGCAGYIKHEQEWLEQKQEWLEQLRANVELAKAAEDEEEYKKAVQALRDGVQVAFTEMARLRHITAVAKIPYVIDHVKEILETGQKVVVFAHHHDVINAIMAEFGNSAVRLTGEDSKEKRDAAVQAFQNDDSIRVFVGSIKAAGVGITLTAASIVVFAELDWVPGNVTQAEDRLHRIGQAESVLVQHLVFDESLDAKMAHTLVDKQTVIDAALDDDLIEDAKVPLIPTDDGKHATKSASRKRIDTVAAKLSDEQITTVHQALRMIAGMCDGAKAEDGVGFNKLDTRMGKELARCESLTKRQGALGYYLMRKYHRQLPDDMIFDLGDSNG